MAFPIHVMKKKKKLTIREGITALPRYLWHATATPFLLRVITNYSKEMKQTLICKNGQFFSSSEQSMWWNYRKPKPLKTGAATFATQKGFLLFQCSLTMEDDVTIDHEGMPIQRYTSYFEADLPLILFKSEKENIRLMVETNEKMWKQCYEENYQIPLTYETEKYAYLFNDNCFTAICALIFS